MKLYKKLLFPLLIIGSLVADTPIKMEKPLELTRYERLKNGLPDLAQALAIDYATGLVITFIHELGHKYSAKLLTGADSTIKMNILFGGATVFDTENWKKLKNDPESRILAILAGPLAGCLASYGIYKLAASLDENSKLYKEIQQIAWMSIFGNLAELLPFRVPFAGTYSDGYQIWTAIEEIQNKKEEEKSTPLKLLNPMPLVEKFGFFKKMKPVKPALLEAP